MVVLGVDGCRGGWLAAVVDDRRVCWRWTARIADLLAEDARALAIDIPIGLPESGVRAGDVEARRLLGRRGVTVFPAPVRPVLACTTYAEARAVLAARGGASMSAQAFGIVPAVRAVDEALAPVHHDRVVESHPELAFLRLTGQPLASKRSPLGITQRLDAVAAEWPDVRSLVAKAPAPAAVDDALDALACAVTARRWLTGGAIVLGDGSTDSHAHPMRIAY